MIEKFTSVKEVIAKVYRDLSLQDEDRWLDMVEWAAEALEQIGAFPQYINKVKDIEINAFRAAIPCDLHKVVGIMYKGETLRHLSGAYDVADGGDKNTNHRTISHPGYTMNDAWFNFNFKQGEIKISYIGIPTDEDGFPQVPDNISYKEAIEKYIVMKLKYGDFINEKIRPDTWMQIKRDWHWYCSQARGKANMPNADKMESIKNMWNKLKPEMNQHRTGFTELSQPDRLTR